ncbi:uncharacterized protein [Venturia canescens]|uniref:uncharacterized protein n=1 Tax=Venturia canescens TaxID=32260 RepID=UPI001C9D367D|nr:uncharacterized protein LOC122406431 [Venturia canescens]
MEFETSDNKLTTEDVAAVYYLTTSVDTTEDKDFLKLSAKYEEEIFNVWIKPSKPRSKLESSASWPRFKFRKLDFAVDGVKQSSVSLNIALSMFREFLTIVPKKVLLVTHAPEIEFTLLSQAIKKVNMTNTFQKVIVGFSNTVPLFRQIISNRTNFGGVTLPNLYTTLLKKEYVHQWPEAAYALNCLEELVSTHLSASKLIDSRVLLALSPESSTPLSAEEETENPE